MDIGLAENLDKTDKAPTTALFFFDRIAETSILRKIRTNSDFLFTIKISNQTRGFFAKLKVSDNELTSLQRKMTKNLHKAFLLCLDLEMHQERSTKMKTQHSQL